MAAIFQGINWVYITLFLMVAAVAAFFAHRQLLGFFIGLGGFILLKPLLMLAKTNNFLALIIATILGLGLALLAQVISARMRLPQTLTLFLGGLGGFLFGLGLLFTMIISLPIELNVSNQVIYPARIPESVSRDVAAAKLVQLGRDIVLYEIYEAGNVTDQITSASPGFVKQVNGLLVTARPWE